MEARNSVGYSLPSAELQVLSAQVPDAPSAPITAINSDLVTITWTIPFDGSTPVTGYIIKIRQSDGITFTEDITDCNGLESQIITSMSCSVPITTLKASPYSLPWGASVYAIVSAINIVGTSAASAEGNGAVILTNPDAPTSLANDATVTLSTQVGLTWSDGAANGGANILDY